MDTSRYVRAKARDMLIRARSSLLVNSPFFGNLAMRLKLVMEPAEETFAVDGVSIFYNPDFVVGLSLAEVRTVLAHEVLHVLLGHHERRAGRDPEKWNMAADYAINPILEREKFFSLPKGALLDARYVGKSAEQIYALLRSRPDDKGSGPGQGAGQGSGKKQDGKSSGASQNPCGEVRDKPENSPSSASQESWKGSAANLVRKFQEGGSLSAEFVERVGELISPSVPWQQVLRQYMTHISHDDFSWTRPNRRFVGKGVYLPSAYSEQMGDIVIAIDVSGSVNIPLLNRFLAEVESILQEVSFNSLQVVQCNTRVTCSEQFFPGDEIHPQVKGGGGTRFQPVFDWVESWDLIPDVLLYFTDLAIPSQYAPKDPGYPVLWIEPQPARSRRWEPSFGELVEIE